MRKECIIMRNEPLVIGHQQAAANRRYSHPVLTLIVVGIIAIGNLAQLLVPALLTAWQRDPAALHAGQWWRVVTPFLVQSDGPLAMVAVLVGLAVVGSVLEQRMGRVVWLVLFVLGCIVGEVTGYAWQPYGAGASVALLSLAGGLVVLVVTHPALLRTRGRADLMLLGAVLYTLALLVSLAVAVFGNAVFAAVGAALAGSSFIWLLQRKASARVIASVIAGICLLSGLILLAGHDIHGPSFAAGVLVTLAYYATTRSLMLIR